MSNQARKQLASLYGEVLSGPTGYFDALEMSMADGAFVCPLESLARAMANRGEKVYRFKI